MTNYKKHTVNSLFNSIQFNSIQFAKIVSLITLLSLTLLFSISCSNVYKAAEGDLDVPTATGNPATVADVVFVGTLTRTALSGISETEAADGFPATLRVAPDSADNFGLEIKNSKVNTGFTGVLYGIQLLSNSDTKVVEASGKNVEEGITTLEYIKITLDDATNPTTATVIYKMGSSGIGINMSATYEGDLTKQTI